MKPIVFSWSSGKDSAMALYRILKSNEYEVVALLTTISSKYDRVSIHGVRKTLLYKQAESIGIPLDIIALSDNPSNEEYEEKMERVMQSYIEKGIRHAAFGDIFLEDLREYRQRKLSLVGMKALFPLWKTDTDELVKSMSIDGFKSIITCVDTQFLSKEFVGKEIDNTLLLKMPTSIDKCGENGEYHSFAYAGPIFHERIEFEIGEKVLRDNRFFFCDLIPK